MASVLLEVFALLTGSALGIIGLLVPDSDNRPDYLAEGHSLVRIGIGLNSSTGRDLGGNIPSINVFNEEIIEIGGAQGSSASYLGAGKYVTIPVYQNETYQQPTYLEVAGGPDPVCIAYVAQTWSDGTQLGWLGDMGKFCGASWYYSNLYVTSNNGSYKPYCTWIGGHRNESTLFRYSGFRIHTPDFGRVDASNTFTVPNHPASLCDWPISVWYQRPRFQSPAPSLRPLQLFSLFHSFGMIGNALSASVNMLPSWDWDEKEQVSFRASIVGSHDVQHSATSLCASPNSWGPDFVSFKEGVFCDMKTKETWPLCDRNRVRNCYDWNVHAVLDWRLKKRAMVYRKVDEWQ